MTGRRIVSLLILFLAGCSSKDNWNKNVLKTGVEKCGSGGCGSGGGCPAGSACNGIGGTNFGCCPPEPIKCCDPSCPKCIGGKAPRPGTACLDGCPLGGCCPGTCPCDDCVCCYTTTSYSTVFTTCYNEVKSTVTRTTTKMKTTTSNITETKIVPVTFSVDEIFLFTSTSVLTDIAARPSFTEETLLTVNIISRSTIFLTTSQVTELSTRQTAPDITVTTNPIVFTTVFISRAPYTSSVDTFLATSFPSTITNIYTGSFVTSFFGFNYTTSPLLTIIFNTTLQSNYTQVLDTFYSTVPMRTSPNTIVGTTTLLLITSFGTTIYSTGVGTTVPGDWTFYKYGTTNKIRTLATTTIARPLFSTTTISDPLTEQVCVVATSNICPTRTFNISSTETIFVLATTTAMTSTVSFGTSTLINIIPSTIVFA